MLQIAKLRIQVFPHFSYQPAFRIVVVEIACRGDLGGREKEVCLDEVPLGVIEILLAVFQFSVGVCGVSDEAIVGVGVSCDQDGVEGALRRFQGRFPEDLALGIVAEFGDGHDPPVQNAEDEMIRFTWKMDFLSCAYFSSKF
jgi:hypothetical protein